MEDDEDFDDTEKEILGLSSEVEEDGDADEGGDETEEEVSDGRRDAISGLQRWPTYIVCELYQ